LCGSSFPEECNLKDDSLYFCADEGDKPKEFDTCHGRGCPPDKNQCNRDPCVCEKSGQFCGSTFPKECKTEQSGLYFCAKPGDFPVFIQNCPSNKCKPGSSLCEPPEVNCNCEKAGQICGSTFDGVCGLDKDILYYCAGKDAVPSPIKTCARGKCPSGENHCEEDLNCNCKGPGRPCGKDFPPGCGLSADMKYQCSQAGDVPQPLVRDPANKCVTDEEGYKERDPCACPGTGITCGSVLKKYNCTERPIKENAIYECVDQEYPVEIKQCLATETCVPLRPNAECQPKPCICTEERQTICGESAPESCNLRPGFEYQCRGGQFFEVRLCEQGCNKFEGKCISNCSCPASGPVCGHEIPGCGLNGNTLYACFEGHLPRELRNCDPTVCVQRDRLPASLKASSLDPMEPNALVEPSMAIFAANWAYNDTCEASPCYCKPGETLRCSKTFDKTCGYAQNLLVSCPKDGGRPVTVDTCDSPEDCIDEDGTAKCKPNECNCKDIAGVLCSSEFPASCKLTPQSVYSCKAVGDLPVHIQSCSPNTCRPSKDGGRCAKSPCMCEEPQVGKKLCPNAFSAECNLEQNAIYRCDKAGEKPVLVQKCHEKAHCDVEDGEATCHSDLCHCFEGSEGSTVCGNLMPDRCQAEPNTIYGCFQEDEAYEVIKDCGKDTCVTSFSNATGSVQTTAVCVANVCVCRKEDVGKRLCGSNFDPSCGYKPDQIQICYQEGVAPHPETDCTPGKCSFDAAKGTATCTDPLCKCDGKAGTRCGSQFPPSCAYEKSKIYVCDDKVGSDPQYVKDCKPENCEFKNNEAKCREQLCACNEDDITICGHGFDKSCGYKFETIWICHGRNTIPTEGDNCLPGICKLEGVESKCIKPDRCLCDRGPPVDLCGSFFPDCPNINNNTLYHCDGKSGSEPVEKKKCKDGVEICGPDASLINDCHSIIEPPKCECTLGKSKMCGSEFPAACKFPPDSLYNCVGKEPVLAEKCDPYKCVITPEAKCDIPPPPPDCKCKLGKAKMCGSEFPPECNFNPNSVYECAADGTAKESEKCDPNKCITTPVAKCDVPQCKCQGDKKKVLWIRVPA
ncbi:hypothetical protein BGZ94_003458, partial [Podila epigama]